MNRTLIGRVAGVLAVAATALLGSGAANAQVAMNQPGSHVQATAAQSKGASTQAVTSAGRCTTYAFSTGDWVRIRATPGGEPILGYSMRFDHYSDAIWPRDYSGNWMKATNLRTGVHGWVSLDWVDWYQPTC